MKEREVQNETSPPKAISASGRGRGRAAGRAAHCSSAVLGHLPRAEARALYANPKTRIEIREGGLGTTCEEFRAKFYEMRQTGICVTRGDLDAGQVSFAGPIFDCDGRVVGSVAVVLEERLADAKQATRVGSLVRKAAAQITAALADEPIR